MGMSRNRRGPGDDEPFGDLPEDTAPRDDRRDGGYYADIGPAGGDTGERRSALEETPSQSMALRSVPLCDLIARRDRFLTECFDIESGQRFLIDGQEAEDRLGYLRGHIEEIHEELARRDTDGEEPADLPAPVPQPQAGRPQPDTRHADTVSTPLNLPRGTTGDRLHTDEDIDAYLRRAQYRILQLDDLARLAQSQGNIEQAMACIVQAQAIDRERLRVLEQLG